MKTKFYCVTAQFFGYGKTLAAVTNSRETACKPRDQIDRKHKLTAFKIWMSSETNANKLVEIILSGEMYIDACIALTDTHLEWERKSYGSAA